MKELETKDDVLSAIQLLTEPFEDAETTAEYLKNIFIYKSYLGMKPLDIIREELNSKNDFDLNLP